ncbi:hypothetical protein [Streptomyces nojiriensis]|uniref:hypothetical protein n=1 Tax=Streptomyces nojiriensis TaxID=66374 RepID=UPI0035D8866E
MPWTTSTRSRSEARSACFAKAAVSSRYSVRIEGNNHLYVNMSGDLRHTVEFRGGDNGRIVALDVPKSFVDEIRAKAVPQEQPDEFGFTRQEWKQVKQVHPGISDPTTK